jgi:hypothetical protein
MKSNLLFLFILSIIYIQTNAQKSIQCSTNKFWAINSDSTIEQFTLNAGIITLDSVVVSDGFSLNLAICNNLDTAINGQTFYNTNSSQIAYYNGSTWALSAVTSPYMIYNGGGNGNFLYFTADVGNGLNTLVRYDGVSLTTVYTIPSSSRKIMVADIAADKYGNIWMFSGITGSVYTDSLHIISPSGQIVSEYAVTFNSQAAYGCFLLDDVIYVGFGTGNSSYPHQLIPISTTSGNAVIGTAITIPGNLNYADLASCNTGDAVATEEISNASDIPLFPNPFDDEITILNNIQGNEISYFVYSLNGSLLLTDKSSDEKIILKMNYISAGAYVLEISTDKFLQRKLIIKH